MSKEGSQNRIQSLQESGKDKRAKEEEVEVVPLNATPLKKRVFEALEEPMMSKEESQKRTESIQKSSKEEWAKEEVVVAVEERVVFARSESRHVTSRHVRSHHMTSWLNISDHHGNTIQKLKKAVTMSSPHLWPLRYLHVLAVLTVYSMVLPFFLGRL